MSKILSKGIQLGYKTGSTATTYTKLDDLVGIPALGAAPEKVDVTTLDNEYRQYINGLKDLGDLEFTFVYDDTNDQYTTLEALKDTEVDWQVKFPGTGGLTFEFSGKPSVAMSAIEVGGRVEYTMSIGLSSDIEIS